MTPEALMTEGQRLAKPCAHLRRRQGEAYAAYWGGRGLVPQDDPAASHWLTIDLRHVPGLGLSGCVSIYTDGAAERGIAAWDSRAALPASPDGDKLFAHSSTSLPPIDAVFLKGSTDVGAWLRDTGWRRDWGYNENFSDSGVAREYERLYQAQCPLYTGDADATLGGWHMPWPEGDWATLLDKALVVWTFRNSEPWIEVWWDGAKFEVLQRIT